MNVDQKLFQLQQQLERWIVRSAYFLPDGDVLELSQSVRALEVVRKDLDALNHSGLGLTKDSESDLLRVTE